MTLNNIVDASHLLQGVNILCIIPQQLATGLHTSDELVTGGGLELARIYFSGKLEKWTGIFLEIMDVKHCLWIRQVRKVYCKPGIDTISGSKVRNTT